MFEESAEIERQVDALSDALHRALSTASGRCWLIVDPMVRLLQVGPMFDGALLARSPQQAPSPADSLDSRLMPLLVELDSAKAADGDVIRMSLVEALEESSAVALAQSNGRRICGWLESRADGATLARHISHHLVQRRPNGIKTLLRWTDPANLWALWPALEPGQRRTLLGPIDTYWLLDPAGRWVPLQARSPGTAATRLHLTDAQWAEADALVSLNEALRDWGAANAMPDALIAARQDGTAALRRARAIGFTDDKDLAAFARCALMVHPNFDRHPLVRDRLAKREADDYFTALVDDLTPEAWQRIRTDGDTASPAEGDRRP